MFWDNVSSFYDISMGIRCGRVNRLVGEKVSSFISKEDYVLECACGTGIISKHIAGNCKLLMATDYSSGMLKRARKKLSRFDNVIIEESDIFSLSYRDEAVDKVVAANVIHLLDNPRAALDEFLRVCKAGGKAIIPTYVNKEKNGRSGLFIRIADKLGAGFSNQFTFESYKDFIRENVSYDVDFYLINGSMPCAIAVIDKE